MAETKFGSDFDADAPAAQPEGFASDLFSMPIAIGDTRFDAPAEPGIDVGADLSDAIEDAVELDVSSVTIEDDEPGMDAPSDPNAIADEAFDTEMPILAAGAIPPERVRFAVPLDIMVEGDSDLYRGAVLNLSTTGIACALPLDLTPGQRIWVRFKLGLGEEPLSLLCAVIWRRDLDSQHVLYGVQFVSLTDQEAERIASTVKERLEGRAADWPLPVMPSPEQPRPAARRQTSSWSSAAFGMIGGMGLALLLSALPHVFGAGVQDDEDEPLPTATVAEAPVADPLPPLPTAVTIGAQSGARAVAEAVKPAAVEPEAPALEAPVPVVVAKIEEPTLVAKTAAPAKVAQAEKAPVPAKPSSDLLPRKPAGAATEVTLASGSAGAKPHAFWLDNPRRYVVDVPGKRDAKTPEAKGLVSKVRVGSYEDKTRYVLEVASNVHDARVEPRGNALVVTLSK